MKSSNYENHKNWVKANKDKVLEYRRQYDKVNRDRINARRRKQVLKRKQEDPLFKLTVNLRSRLNIALKHEYKSGSAINDLGCSVKFFKEYIESQFQPGMTWDNWGKKSNMWNIDHIIPLSSVNLSNREELMKVCHYTNLRPMWSQENLKKGSKNVTK